MDTGKVTFEEFLKLQEAADDAVRYELDEGELIRTPSRTIRDSIVSFRLICALDDFAKEHHLGIAIHRIDFRLGPDIVRMPYIALIARDRLKALDLDPSPIDGAPLLAIEIISARDLAQDMRKKVCQYLAAGSQAVWLVYPLLKVIEIHDRDGIRGVIEQ